MRRKRLATVSILVLLALVVSLIAVRSGMLHYLLGRTIRPGMTFHQVYSRMGKPYIGFGLPQKGTKEKTHLFYTIPFQKYLVVNFVGDIVDDPPVSICDRSAIRFE